MTIALHPQRLLVRGVNWLGDAVMSTPALQRLRNTHPEAQITLLTPIKLGGLWPSHPAIDKVMTFSKDEAVFQVARRIRAERFDAALVLPNSPRSAIEVFLGRVPVRIGYQRPWRNLFLTHRIPARCGAIPMRKRSVSEIKRLIDSSKDAHAISATAHHVYQYLHLTAALGAPPEPLAPHIEVTREEVAAILARFGVRRESSGPPLFGLNAGAEYGPAKRWPRERFVAAAKALHRQTECQWWILGGPEDQEIAAAIAAELPADSAQCLAGKTSLRDLCAALKACDLLLTNDTGPMHLAAAVGTPVVALFGSTSPELTGPGLPGEGKHFLLKSGVACAPCFRRECPVDFRCMNTLGVDQVVAALLKADWRRY